MSVLHGDLRAQPHRSCARTHAPRLPSAPNVLPVFRLKRFLLVSAALALQTHTTCSSPPKFSLLERRGRGSAPHYCLSARREQFLGAAARAWLGHAHSRRIQRFLAHLRGSVLAPEDRMKTRSWLLFIPWDYRHSIHTLWQLQQQWQWPPRYRYAFSVYGPYCGFAPLVK